MRNFSNSTITYTGISDYLPYEINSFTQSNINHIFKLEDNLTDVDEILKVDVNSKIINSRLVKTAFGTSLEGQHLTGWKYLVESVFYLRIDYCGINPEGSIFTIKKEIPFNVATTLREDTTCSCTIIENIFIEDIFSQVINNREILININYLFVAEDC